MTRILNILDKGHLLTEECFAVNIFSFVKGGKVFCFLQSTSLGYLMSWYAYLIFQKINFLSKKVNDLKIVDALSYVLCYILFLLSIHNNNFKFEDISSTHCFQKVKTNSVLIFGSLDRIFLFFRFILLYCLLLQLQFGQIEIVTNYSVIGNFCIRDDYQVTKSQLNLSLSSNLIMDI